jgi:hypothetical protein
MKVAVLSESSADEAAILRLAAAILGRTLDTITPKVRHRGWPNVQQVLPNILCELFYATDAQGVIVVIDADTSPIHRDDHDSSDLANADCRICQLQRAAAAAMARWRKRPCDLRLRLALGLATPALEAWLLCGSDPSVSEASWNNARQQGTFPYTTANLKRAVYGTDRPSIDHETQCMIREADRLIAHRQLELLEHLFPVGFGMLARELRAWVTIS